MNPGDPTYLDHAATSPLLPEALEAMMPWFTTEYGNPSSVYGKGRKARHALEKARARVADVLGVGPAEVIFTSCGSESNNTVLQPHSDDDAGVMTSAVEHEAVLEPVRRWKRNLILTPDAVGRVTTDLLDTADTSDISLASFMLVNNELGTINPITDLADWCHARGMRFHTDAAQAARTVDLRPVSQHADYLSLTGHKFGGPKGIGVLMVKAGSPHAPMIRGGGQEQERRSGTENVAFAVGLATALEHADTHRHSFMDHALALKEQLLAGLEQILPGRYQVTTPPKGSTPHINHIRLIGGKDHPIDGEMLILGLDIEGMAVSAGSACSSGTMKASHVLEAIGLASEPGASALRVSFGPQTTSDDVDRFVMALNAVMGRMNR